MKSNPVSTYSDRWRLLLVAVSACRGGLGVATVDDNPKTAATALPSELTRTRSAVLFVTGCHGVFECRGTCIGIRPRRDCCGRTTLTRCAHSADVRAAHLLATRGPSPHHPHRSPAGDQELSGGSGPTSPNIGRERHLQCRDGRQSHVRSPGSSRHTTSPGFADRRHGGGRGTSCVRCSMRFRADGRVVRPPHVIAEAADAASERLRFSAGFFKDALPSCDA